MKLQYILERWGDNEDDELDVRMDNRQQKINKLNDLTGIKSNDYGFVDFLLDDINHLYVLIALTKIGDISNGLLDEYINLDKQRSRLLNSWQDDIQSKRLTKEQIGEEYEKFTSWINARQARLDEWIGKNMTDISWERPTDDMAMTELAFYLESVINSSQQDKLSDIGN